MRENTQSSFAKQYVDYSGGREGAPLLTVMVGPAGSGKTTASMPWVNWGGSETVRFNRDALRSMLFADVPWNNYNEDFVRKYEEEGVRLALSKGKNVVVDDTNCVARDRLRWECVAHSSRARFCLCMMNTSYEECIERNRMRPGKGHVPEEAIKRQFSQLREVSVRPEGYALETNNRAILDRQALKSGHLTLRKPASKIVLCDIDGTLADCEGVREPHDEEKVLLDICREPVAAWLRALYPTYNIIMVSGRGDNCSADTCDWLASVNAPFDHIFMRSEGSSVSDHIVKQQILDELLAVVPKSQIAFVIDDRWKVVRMWKANGLTVYPVGGTTEHSETCTFEPDKQGWKHCPECGALEDF